MLHFALLRTAPSPLFFYNTARQRNYSCSSRGSSHKSQANDCWLLSSSCSRLKIAGLLAGQACQSSTCKFFSTKRATTPPPLILRLDNTFGLLESEGSDTTVVQSEHGRVSPRLTHSRGVAAAAAATASRRFHLVFSIQANNTGYQRRRGPEAEHSLPQCGDNLHLPRWKNKSGGATANSRRWWHDRLQ